VSSVKYELGFYITEDDILHSHSGGKFKYLFYILSVLRKILIQERLLKVAFYICSTLEAVLEYIVFKKGVIYEIMLHFIWEFVSLRHRV
jgi:hypothetical protein